jgi:hypothetical protein
LRSCLSRFRLPVQKKPPGFKPGGYIETVPIIISRKRFNGLGSYCIIKKYAGIFKRQSLLFQGFREEF